MCKMGNHGLRKPSVWDLTAEQSACLARFTGSAQPTWRRASQPQDDQGPGIPWPAPCRPKRRTRVLNTHFSIY
jgi:hypothetical protein